MRAKPSPFKVVARNVQNPTPGARVSRGGSHLREEGVHKRGPATRAVLQEEELREAGQEGLPGSVQAGRRVSSCVGGWSIVHVLYCGTR